MGQAPRRTRSTVSHAASARTGTVKGSTRRSRARNGPSTCASSQSANAAMPTIMVSRVSTAATIAAIAHARRSRDHRRSPAPNSASAKQLGRQRGERLVPGRDDPERPPRARAAFEEESRADTACGTAREDSEDDQGPAHEVGLPAGRRPRQVAPERALRAVCVLAVGGDDRRPLQQRVLGERGERLAVAAHQQRLDVVAVVGVEGHVGLASLARVGPCRVDEVEDDGGRDHHARECDGEGAAGVGL